VSPRWLDGERREADEDERMLSELRRAADGGDLLLRLLQTPHNSTVQAPNDWPFKK